MSFPDSFPTLTTPRLLLRETAPHDVDAVFEMESDPVAMRYWSRPPMKERSEAEAAVARAMRLFGDRAGIRWAVCSRSEDTMLGHCSLFAFNEQCGRAEIGYGLLRRHWGQGLMQEALTAVLDHAFGPLALRRIEADIDPRNAASVRALERLGFSREGLLRERWVVAGEISDSVLMGLLAREWQSRTGGSAS